MQNTVRTHFAPHPWKYQATFVPILRTSNKRARTHVRRPPTFCHATYMPGPTSPVPSCNTQAKH